MICFRGFKGIKSTARKKCGCFLYLRIDQCFHCSGFGWICQFGSKKPQFLGLCAHFLSFSRRKFAWCCMQAWNGSSSQAIVSHSAASTMSIWLIVSIWLWKALKMLKMAPVDGFGMSWIMWLCNSLWMLMSSQKTKLSRSILAYPLHQCRP